MPCNFTACLGPVGLALETVAEVADDEAFPAVFFCTKSRGIIPSRPSSLFALYQFGSMDLLMIVRESPRLKGRSFGN